jgi:hypothetical protein
MAVGWRVTFRQRHENAKLAARSQGASHGEREFPLAIEDVAQQRAPRQGDADLVSTAAQAPQRFARIADKEQRIRQRLLARGAPRRLNHARGVRVDADHQSLRPLPSQCKDGRAIPRPEVDHDRADMRGDLADVHLDQLLPDDPAHRAR